MSEQLSNNPGVSDPHVLDLDDLVEKPLPFRLHGKQHEISPISLEEFLSIAAGFKELSLAANDPERSVVDLINAYHNLFSRVCKTITREDVEKMQQAQCASLLILIMERMQGETAKTLVSKIGSLEKKKP